MRRATSERGARPTRRARADRGEGGLSYLAIAAVVAGIATTLMVTDVGGEIAGGVSDAVCDVVGGECSSAGPGQGLTARSASGGRPTSTSPTPTPIPVTGGRFPPYGSNVEATRLGGTVEADVNIAANAYSWEMYVKDLTNDDYCTRAKVTVDVAWAKDKHYSSKMACGMGKEIHYKDGYWQQMSEARWRKARVDLCKVRPDGSGEQCLHAKDVDNENT